MKTLIALTTTCLMVTSLNSQATDYESTYIDDNQIVDYARVISADPIYETVAYTRPHRECRYEERVVHEHRSKTPVILGTLIGGAIGNELGHREINKKVGTVAGAILGASIANDISHKHQRPAYTKREKVCSKIRKVSYKEEITGYNVTYKYRGNVFETFMDQAPGDKIKVAVSIQPL